MSLDFWFDKCDKPGFKEQDYGWTKNDDGGSEIHPVTQTLIFATLSVGLGEITENNIAEFYGRLKVLYEFDKVGGMIELEHDGDKTKRVERIVTEQEVFDHIGLRTNVSNETRTKWANRMFVANQTSVTEQFAYGFRTWQRKQEKENPIAAKA